MSRNILLDWSGTLVDDLPPVVEATNRILAHYGRPELTRDVFRERFRLPFAGFWEELLPGVPLEELEVHYHRFFDPIQSRVEPLPGALEFLEYCRRSGRRLFLLSSINRAHWDFQSEHLGLGRFFENAYVQVMDKRRKVREILEANGLDPARTMFVGDMVHDVETARHAGILSVATLTGFDPPSKLSAARPDLTIHGLDGLMKVLASQDGGDERLPVSTVGALIFDRRRRVLMVRTHKWSGRWGIPGGKIQRGERAVDALHREIFEETGLRLRRPRFECVQDCIDSPEFIRSEHFLLLNYTAELDSGHGSGVTLNDEAEDFRWVELEKTLDMELNGPTRRLLRHVMDNGGGDDR